MEGLYLIKLREFIKTNEEVYKFGRSFNLKKRITQYLKNSKIEFLYTCIDTKINEKKN